MDYSDWFESIVGIPILAASGKTRDPEPEISSRIYSLFSFLEETEAKDRHGNLIVEKAREDYLKNVKDRANHLYTKSEELLAKAKGEKNANPGSATLSNAIRDYYHSAYYCLFYCARTLLIKNKKLDSNIHEKLPEHLVKFAKSDPSFQDLVDKLTAGLRSLQSYRNQADYIMRSSVVTILSEDSTLDESMRILSNMSRDCGARS